MHPCERPIDEPRSLAELLQTIGKQAVFMTDDPEIAQLDFMQGFNEVFCFDPTDERAPLEIEDSEGDSEELSAAKETAEWTETRLASFVEAALGELSRYAEHENGFPELTWLHLSGLARTWDAPYEYRTQLCDDEDDPEPPRGDNPASFDVDSKTDPDAIFGAACGAAAQGMIVDQIWNWIDTFLDEFVNREDCMVVLAGLRGFPLGEHHCVGLHREDLYSELVHVPLMIQPGIIAIGSRSDSIVQSMSIWTTLLHWLITESKFQEFVSQEVAERPLAANLLTMAQSELLLSDLQTQACLIATDTSAYLQVRRWTALWNSSVDSKTNEHAFATRLFLSPDDRWEQNDVTSRAKEIAEAMEELRDAWQSWLSVGCPSSSRPALPDCLKRPV